MEPWKKPRLFFQLIRDGPNHGGLVGDFTHPGGMGMIWVKLAFFLWTVIFPLVVFVFFVVDGDLFSWNLKDYEGNNNREIGYILIRVCFLSYSLKKRV